MNGALSWFYVDVQRYRANSHSTISNTKRVPRVRFYYGYDPSFMDMKMLSVLWSPRNPCQEGEELYKHYVTLKWRPLFHFYWR